MIDKKLKEYAKLAVCKGVNLQPEEELVIASPVNCADLAYAIAECAYKEGAKRVTMLYRDPNVTKLSYLYEDNETIVNIPDWVIASRDFIVDSNACYINILSEDPELLNGVSPIKLFNASRASHEAFHKLSDATSRNRTRWCLIAAPNLPWAKKMFPDLSDDEAMDKLWTYIHITMRMDTENSMNAWEDHQYKLQIRSKYLNDAGIVSFHYKNSIGTDFTIGMPEGYKFTGATETSLGGVDFTANMPTEEVFSSPDRLTANGTLVASMPLVYNGSVIENFGFTFENGHVTQLHAEKGEDLLERIVRSDTGSCYLGEIALVGYSSPIQRLNTLFYNTLFDENASCHFALGRGFSSCIKGGDDMDISELLEKGINYSLEHVDFMVGTPDLTITAKTKDGKTLSIFKNGDWDLTEIK